MKTLYYFCQYFPYGQREPLAETEIFQLAPHFQKIIIIPFFKEDGIRPIPPNAQVHWFEKSTRTWNSPKTCSTFQASQNILKRIPEIGPFDQWNPAFARKWRAARIHAERLMFDLNISSETILYSPWMTPWGPTLSIIKEHQQELKVFPTLFFRANGADLYRERMSALQRKFQAVSLELATRVFPVSEHGSEHLKTHYPRHSWKIETAYHGHPPIRGVFNVQPQKRWLTISTLQPVKRLERMFEILSKMNESIEWIHIGGEGNELSELKKRSELLPKNIKIDFRGRMPHFKIIELLQEESFDLFLNVSDSEGLPLSAVEAASAGIPLLLSDVGGSKEIPGSFVLPIQAFQAAEWVQVAKKLQHASIEERGENQKKVEEQFGLKNYSKFAKKITFAFEGTIVVMDDNLPGYSIAKSLIDAGVSHQQISVIRKRKGRMHDLSIADFNPELDPKPWILFPLNEKHWEDARIWKEKDPNAIRLTFDPQTRDFALHKHIQREKVDKAGIPTVPFQRVGNFNQGEFSLPWVVKPSNKMEKGRNIERFYLIKDAADWANLSVHFQPTDLVEEWKNKAKVAAVVGFNGENGMEQFSAFRRRCYPDHHTVFSSIEVIENKTLLDLSKEILKELPIKGLFEIEFLEAENGFQFLELNNRATTWIEAWRWAGINVVYQTFLWAIAEPTQMNGIANEGGWLVHRKNEWLNLRHKPDQFFWLIHLKSKGKKVLWI